MLKGIQYSKKLIIIEINHKLFYKILVLVKKELKIILDKYLN